MPTIPVVRGAYLNLYIDLLNKTGTSLNHYLLSANLPTIPDQDDYVAAVPMMRFLAEVAQKEGIPDLGFKAAKRMQIGDLNAKVVETLDSCPTLYERLKKLCQLASWECSPSEVWMTWHGTNVRVNSAIKGAAGKVYPEYLQWLTTMMVVCIVRQVAGPRWSPAAIAFPSHFMPTKEAQAFFPDTRFLTGEKNAWIEISDRILHRPIHKSLASTKHGATLEAGFALDFPATVSVLLRPYFEDGSPKAETLAAVMGVGVRTLQRHLREYGTGYFELVQQVRLRIAMDLLSEHRNSITEIAYATGYSDVSHFSRAFRRWSGVSPQVFRTEDADARQWRRQVT